MKHLLYTLFLFVLCPSLHAQQNNGQDQYFTAQPSFRGFGTGDFMTFSFGGNYNRQVKRLWGYGLSSSFAHVTDNALPNIDILPNTFERSDYDTHIFNWQIKPYAQFLPVNTHSFDIFLQAGTQFGIYDQTAFQGGWGVTTDPNTGERWISLVDLVEEENSKGLYLGYDLGLGMNIDFQDIRLSPKANFGYDLNGNSISNIGIEVGRSVNW